MKHGKIPARQWFVWMPLAGIALLLGLEQAGVLKIGAQNEHRNHGHANAASTRLLPIPIEQVAVVEIIQNGARFVFQREGGGALFVQVHDHTAEEKHHSHGPGNDVSQLINRSLAAFGRSRIKRKFAAGPIGTPSGDADYGFAHSDLTVAVYQSPRRPPVARFIVGNFAPDGLSRYVAIEGTADVMTIAQYQVENLVMLVETLLKLHR